MLCVLSGFFATLGLNLYLSPWWTDYSRDGVERARGHARWCEVRGEGRYMAKDASGQPHDVSAITPLLSDVKGLDYLWSLFVPEPV